MSDFEEKYGELLPVDEIPEREKKRFKVTLQVTVEVEAYDEDGAIDGVCDAKIEPWEWEVEDVKEQ